METVTIEEVVVRHWQREASGDDSGLKMRLLGEHAQGAACSEPECSSKGGC